MTGNLLTSRFAFPYISLKSERAINEVAEIHGRPAVNVEHLTSCPSCKRDNRNNDHISNSSLQRRLPNVTDGLYAFFSKAKVDVDPAPEEMSEDEVRPPCRISALDS